MKLNDLIKLHDLLGQLEDTYIKENGLKRFAEYSSEEISDLSDDVMDMYGSFARISILLFSMKEKKFKDLKNVK